MKFSDILGKEDAKRQLVALVDNDRLPHAQLFIGKEGSGGLALAIAMANYLLCVNRAIGDSCGTCAQCTKTSKYVHPDVHFAFPVVSVAGKTRGETTSDDFLPKWRSLLLETPYFSMTHWLDHNKSTTGQPNINVKECNNILLKLNMMAYESHYKILILWLPEYLGNEANRLLKLIEEPTDNTFIILVTENSEAILQTILSRCQLVKVPGFTHQQITDYLVNEVDVTTENAFQLANLADGNIELAKQLSQSENLGYSRLLIEWMRACYIGDPVEINSWMTAITEKSKNQQVNFFEYGLHFYRQFISMYYTNIDSVYLTPQEVITAQKMKATINPSKAEKIISILSEGIEVVPRNINIKIWLFAASIELTCILRNN